MEWLYHGEATAPTIESELHRLPIAVIGIDLERATRAAALQPKHNLGCADAFAAELAIERGAWLVTVRSRIFETRKSTIGLSTPRDTKPEQLGP